MSLSLSCTANEDACTPVVEACDKALKDKDAVIDLSGHLHDKEQNIVDAQDKYITTLESKNHGLFSDPLVPLVIGLVVGGYLVHQGQK